MDFFRHTPVQENGFNSTTNSSSDAAKQQQSPPKQQHKKRSATEFQSVTGGLLEEVVGIINASSGSDKYVE